MWEYSCPIHMQLCSLVSLHVQTTICQPTNNSHSMPVDQRQLSDFQLNITFVVIIPGVFNTEF